ncbi:hypothetical protein Goshw_018132, partial [Gossypium schwendimanii]|nr:hypothetical protein [Gossypium schwendimanii]
LSGEIPPQFTHKIPGNATIDLSFNKFTREISNSAVLKNQESKSFSGIPLLYGEVTEHDCPIPSSPTSSPAIVVISKTIESDILESSPRGKKPGQNKLKPGIIIGIIVKDIVGIGFVIMVFLLAYKLKRKKIVEATMKQKSKIAKDNWSITSLSSKSRGFMRWSCLRKRGEYEEKSDTREDQNESKSHDNQRQKENEHEKEGILVTVDGEKQLELNMLLKASTFILGATGSSKMYKIVLEDRTSLVAYFSGWVEPRPRKQAYIFYLAQPDLGSAMINSRSIGKSMKRKVGSSHCHLPPESQLKIAKGVAYGLAYLHEKKHVHANLKPRNVLLGLDMEPKIGDFGLQSLITSDTSSKFGISGQNFGSRRSTTLRESFQDLV